MRLTNRLLLLTAILILSCNRLYAIDLEVQFSPKVHTQSYTGPVLLFFSKHKSEPCRNLNWFDPEPIVRVNVTNWLPEQPLLINSNSADVLSLPDNFSELDLNGWKVQAVARFNQWERNAGEGPGNGISSVVTINKGESSRLVIDQLIAAKRFPETEDRRYFEVQSKSMSQFYERTVFIKAGVLLPKSYHTSPDQRYPVIYEIPGFGGDEHHINRRSNAVTNSLGIEFIRVMLNPDCPLGHHVFANSANNGPWGDALVEEFLPAFDEQFRTIADAKGRYLTGHSSGGWSSLWLMTTYPDAFAGTWSTSPDPVDFRDFQRINLYDPTENMFVDQAGTMRPLARRNGQVLIDYKRFSDMELVLGNGGQLHSFEAVFSHRDSQGNPQLLFDRETGAINHEVAESWKPYDIRRRLEDNWDILSPKLKGKLHIYMGTEDTFYLEGATELLKASQEKLNSDAHIELISGKDHMNLFEGDLQQRIEQSMAEIFSKP